MKKVYLFILFFLLVFVCGCDNSSNSNMLHKKCTRSATATKGTEVSLNYDIYYTGDVINKLISMEKVTTSNSSQLDIYEDAYKNIHVNYDGLDYYDTKVVRDENSVTSSIIINYDKVDIKKLLEIEGEEDNIIENGKAKLDKWLDLAKKFGTKCEDVED